MNEKENKNFKAGTISQGLTKTTEKKLSAIGQTLGITQEEINNTVKKKSMIQNCVLVVVALLITAYSSVLYSGPTHYVGISIKDFDTIGQMMYTMFGRIF